jgi:hypothetical protein
VQRLRPRLRAPAGVLQPLPESASQRRQQPGEAVRFADDGQPGSRSAAHERRAPRGRASDERDGGLSGALVRLVPTRRRARRLDRLPRRRARLRSWERGLGDRHRLGLVRRCLLPLVLFLAGGVGAAQARFPSPPHWWLAGPGACIRTWESGDGRTSPNLYGMLDGWEMAGGHGWAGDASRTEQDFRSYRLWRRFGWEPWRGQTASRCELRWAGQ